MVEPIFGIKSFTFESTSSLNRAGLPLFLSYNLIYSYFRNLISIYAGYFFENSIYFFTLGSNCMLLVKSYQIIGDRFILSLLPVYDVKNPTQISVKSKIILLYETWNFGASSTLEWCTVPRIKMFSARIPLI